MEENHFAHFYDGPEEEFENLPTHVMFMIDTTGGKKNALEK